LGTAMGFMFFRHGVTLLLFLFLPNISTWIPKDDFVTSPSSYHAPLVTSHTCTDTHVHEERSGLSNPDSLPWPLCSGPFTSTGSPYLIRLPTFSYLFPFPMVHIWRTGLGKYTRPTRLFKEPDGLLESAQLCLNTFYLTVAFHDSVSVLHPRIVGLLWPLT
jgi:hypothetical protein